MYQAKGPNHNQLQDLFDREGGGGSDDTPLQATITPIPLDKASVQPPPPPTHFSEDLWQDALRRHQGARQQWRQLLDRYIKPH